MKNGTIKNGKLSNIINNNNNEIGFDEQEIDEEEQQQYSGNPFVHRLEDGGLFDHIKTAVFTVILLPFRVLFICLLLCVAWLLACIGLYKISPEDLAKRPLTGWRKQVQLLTAAVMRLLFVAGSFHWIQIKGVKASPKEAPVVVVAPHSSFFDSLVVLLVGPPSVVAKAETAKLPFIGQLINYTQPIYVCRDDPDSRQNTIKAIIERANSTADWPQIIIFPEGTCTNRKALITFKPGGFYPGVPVQPVLIRYPNKLDSFTWTWDGPGVLKLLWLTLTKTYSSCEVEFMPVYVPNDQEKLNPKLYAKNVRNVMSKALSLPVSEYTYSDCQILSRAKEMNLPNFLSIVHVEKLRATIGLNQTNIEEQVITSNLVNDTNNLVTYSDFCMRLQIPPTDSSSKRLYSIFEDSSGGEIDFREYLLCALFVIKYRKPKTLLLQLIFKMYENTSSVIGRKAFVEIMGRTIAMQHTEADKLFDKIKRPSNDSISFDDFLAHAEKQPEFAKIFKVPKEFQALETTDMKN